MNDQLLFTVDQAFQISGRGCVLVPGIPSLPGIPDVRVGDRIRLIKPDGESIETRVNGMEMINYGTRLPPVTRTVPISLPKEITKQQVPQGTQVVYLGRAI